eukprot:NODE_1716_length_1428_cov_47.936911_g1548_i0.p1 GENE.NODE_1716_length_1428_cov_47.936911_g1548_i0~~NODE_1716_length_1428_cov_47.936911_g1548_i0.p1  ORF type:complete len:325 (-),score=68.30 NODE_1716_length_1428_cov_47.936911_g1548_i0:397-1371(-)
MGCFGLLGPNGAGKTTTLSILSGLLEPTSGTAYINGHDVTQDIESVHLSIGLCPQHDIFWGKHLTCEDHLLFFSRLKGVPPHAEQDHVTYWLSKVGLLHKRHSFPTQMSGGEQRRLSIAIALSGNPKTVFFDEPTTGLDPSVRREIWNIITDAKQQRCVILTTHSMEEAEVLSDKIGIVALGSLRCLGTPLHLKSKYGKGFRVTVAFEEINREKALGFLLGLCPGAAEIGLGIKGTATFEIDPATISISQFFMTMEEEKTRVGIADWGLSQASLEDVFLTIVKLSETENIPGLETASMIERRPDKSPESPTKALPDGDPSVKCE